MHSPPSQHSSNGQDPSYDHLVEEDYIEIEISSVTLLCYTTISSPPHSREFEFQMSTNPRDREATTYPADDLMIINKGKLLPRFQMVQKPLIKSSTMPPHGEFPDVLKEKVMTTPAAAAATSTAFESCNISPGTSCCVNGKPNSEKHYFKCSDGLVVQSKQKKSWSRRLKLIRLSSLGLKLKASQAYLKSLFTKSGCSDESCEVPIPKECPSGHMKAGKKNPLMGQTQREKHLVADKSAATLIRSIDGKKPSEEVFPRRKSFSGIIKWHSTILKSSSFSSSSSSSANSSKYCQPLILERSRSVSSEVESLIQGAIAYCKKSQELVSTRKSVSDVGAYYSLPTSRIAAECENQERPGLWRG